MIFFAFAMVAATSKDRRASTSVLTYLAEDHKIIERFIAKSSSVCVYIGGQVNTLGPLWAREKILRRVVAQGGVQGGKKVWHAESRQHRLGTGWRVKTNPAIDLARSRRG